MTEFFTVASMSGLQPQLMKDSQGDIVAVLFASRAAATDFIEHWDTSGETNVVYAIPDCELAEWIKSQKNLNSVTRVSFNPSPDEIAYSSIPIDVLIQTLLLHGDMT